MSTDIYAATLSDDERIEQLRVKFTRVRELLKKNVIKLLEVEPPSFIPPTPNQRWLSPGSTKLKTSHGDSLHAVTNYSPAEDGLHNFTNDSQADQGLNAGTKYPSADDGLHDVTNDSLVEFRSRPQFCMTYSMEDDLSPGVKEICLTSTPKSNTSRGYGSTNELGRLSTFNSVSSASSQSELEISNISNKVPVTTLKSATLPHGLDRFPFYSSHEDSAWLKKNDSAKDTKSQVEEKPKKSHFSFRKFSKRLKGKSSTNS